MLVLSFGAEVMLRERLSSHVDQVGRRWYASCASMTEFLSRTTNKERHNSGRTMNYGELESGTIRNISADGDEDGDIGTDSNKLLDEKRQ